MLLFELLFRACRSTRHGARRQRSIRVLYLSAGRQLACLESTRKSSFLIQAQ